jgi:hypothetical protein
VLTTGEAKAYLGRGAGDKTDEQTLTRVVDALTEAFAAHFGPVLQATVTAEEHRGGRPRLRVRRGPVAAWSAVVEWDGTSSTTLTRQTPGTSPTAGYLAEAGNDGLWTGWISRTVSGEVSRFAPTAVTVTYTSGRFATVDDVPARWKEAAAVALVNWWRLYEPSVAPLGEYDVPRASFPRFTVPQAVIEMLYDEYRPPGGYGVG